MRPGHIATIQALTRLQIKANKPDGKTTQRLQTIALQGESPQWRDWVRLDLAKRDVKKQVGGPQRDPLWFIHITRRDERCARAESSQP